MTQPTTPERTPPGLHHYAYCRFKDRYWDLDTAGREAFHAEWSEALTAASDRLRLYQVYPADTSSDVLIWSAVREAEGCATAAFFERFARATNPHRHLVEPVTILWGYTRPSQYSRARSKQELDPFDDNRKRYLIVYPFVKTTDWYLLGSETRQGMMNEHIRTGKQFSDISQLLLYSYGLQNQEFVVVYETDEPRTFSDLVRELRATEGRRYTERDTPLHTAVYRPVEDVLRLWR